MKAVVLAAGEGSRLRPLTDDKPKALVKVNGKPLIFHCFNQLTSLEPEEIITVVTGKDSPIIECFGDEFGQTTLRYVYQPEPLGLADALLQAENYLDDEFIITYGDVIFQADLADCVSHHQRVTPDGTVLVMDLPPEEASESGVCVTDETGSIKEVVEKPDNPPTTLALPGFFVLDPVILHACHLVTPSDRNEYELLDAINLLIQAGRAVEMVRAEGQHVNVNEPEEIPRAERLLSKGEL